MFGDVFLTKDAEEGIGYGFIIKDDLNRYKRLSGLIALRYPFELGVNKFMWQKCKEVGFSNNESMKISLNFCYNSSDSTIYSRILNVNHLPIDPSTPITSYEKPIDKNPMSVFSRFYTPFKPKVYMNTRVLGDGLCKVPWNEVTWGVIREIFKEERDNE